MTTRHLTPAMHRLALTTGLLCVAVLVASIIVLTVDDERRAMFLLVMLGITAATSAVLLRIEACALRIDRVFMLGYQCRQLEEEDEDAVVSPQRRSAHLRAVDKVGGQ